MSSNDLTGRKILAPARLWPDLKPPKGQNGWAGKVTSKKTDKPLVWFVKFPDDPSKYFFDDKDVRQWLVEEKGSKKRSAAAAPEGAGPSSAKKATGPSSAVAPKTASPTKSPTKPASPSKSPTKIAGKQQARQKLFAEADALMRRMDDGQLQSVVDHMKSFFD